MSDEVLVVQWFWWKFKIRRGAGGVSLVLLEMGHGYPTEMMAITISMFLTWLLASMAIYFQQYSIHCQFLLGGAPMKLSRRIDTVPDHLNYCCTWYSATKHTTPA